MASKLAELKRTGAKVAAESVGGKPGIGIFPREIAPEPAARNPMLAGVKPLKGAVRIELGRIEPDPDQPRKEFDSEEIGRLGESLLLHSQLQPITVRWSEGQGKYLVVTGERRFRAAKLIGWPTIAAVIVDETGMEDGLRLERQLVENLHRQDLGAIEEAQAFRRLMDSAGMTGEQLARVLAISPGKVSKALKLLELPEPVQAMVESGALAPGTAYEVAKSPDPEALATRAVEEGLTRSQVSAIVKPPTSLPLFGVYIEKSPVPVMFVAAVSLLDARLLADSHVLPNVPFEVREWLDEIPKGFKAVTEQALVAHLGPRRRPDLPGQAKLPIEVPAAEQSDEFEPLPTTLKNGPKLLPNTGDMYGYYPKGRKYPVYLIRAASEDEAVRYAETQHPKGTPFDVIKWVGPVPANSWIQAAPTKATTPAKVETLDDTKTFHLGGGVQIIVEGPRELVAEPLSWLMVLAGAIREGRVNERGYVQPRSDAQASSKKGARR